MEIAFSIRNIVLWNCSSLKYSFFFGNIVLGNKIFGNIVLGNKIFGNRVLGRKE